MKRCNGAKRAGGFVAVTRQKTEKGVVVCKLKLPKHFKLISTYKIRHQANIHVNKEQAEYTEEAQYAYYTVHDIHAD